MSEINYEPQNKEILDRCCKIISAKSVTKELKSRSVKARRRIEDIKASLEIKVLYDEYD